MKPRTVHCEDCVEDIPNDEIYWEDERMYCGRCGSELELPSGESDPLDTFTGKTARRLYSPEDEEDEEEELQPGEEDEEPRPS